MTDEGICGWGEPVVEGKSRTVETAVRELFALIDGQDPFPIEALWQKLYGRLLPGRTGADQRH